MSWQEFETAAVSAVRQLYSRYEINISETPYSHDGGRDGEAQHILAVGLGPDLAIRIKILLEVKKRKSTNVGKSDIGSHIIDAFASKATKIIFITNREFTEPLAHWVETFCGPLNIQFSLIPGNQLLGLLNKPEAPSIKSFLSDDSPATSEESFNADEWAIQGQLTYTLDPNESTGGTAPCIARADRPLFAIIDLNVGKSVTPFHGTLQLTPKQLDAVTVRRAGGISSDVIFSPGDRQRWVFAIWPESPGQWDASCFDITLQNAEVPLAVRPTNIFRVPEQGLSVALVGSQSVAETAIQHSLATWHMLGGLALRVLLSPGGFGKSFIVGQLRKKWQIQGLNEILLDGEIVDNDVKLIERTFSSLFPFPKTPFENTAKPALVRWLKGLHLSPEACETLADDLCDANGFQPGNYSVSFRAQLFAAILAEASNQKGLVFVLEDLHKVSPSVINIIEEGLALLRSRGRGNVFVLLTSRLVRETGNTNIIADWLMRMQELSAQAKDAVDTLLPPSKSDAHEILRRTVPSLDTVHIQQIVEQVGTTPFNLREAVLYLRQLNVLRSFESGGKPVLAEPDKLSSLLENEDLEQTTKRRLEVFFRDKPEWQRKFVEAGACYGRQFPFCLVAQAIQVPDWEQVMEVTHEAAHWSLMALSSSQRENLEFDHDMVRSAVLSLLPDLRRRELADALLDTIEDSDEPTRMAGLAYQAGHAEQAFDLARSAAYDQSKRGRPLDALKANHIALLTLDPEWAKFDKRSSYWVDVAIQSAPACRRIFSDWKQRDGTALAVLRDNLHCLGTMSSGSSVLSDAILTEARMLSERLNDSDSGASLIALEGRLLFERNDIEGAIARHEEAEKIFAAKEEKKSADRAENLVRLAICQRQKGQQDESLSTLMLALKHRAKSDWTLLNKVRSNTGAAYLRSDWVKVRHHWERQLRSARMHGLISREAHALASLSFINLFDNRRTEGHHQAEVALEISRARALDNTRLRCDLNLSVSFLMEGNIETALQYLNEAEFIAIQHQIRRRLWRVYANLATAYELSGQSEKARARDLQTLTTLKTETWEENSILKRGRTLLPIINIAFRAAASPNFYEPILFDNLRPENILIVKDLAEKITAGEPCLSDGMLLKYLVDIRGRLRFLLTE
jgi:tetratricopeptide (TPR) repeat protein